MVFCNDGDDTSDSAPRGGLAPAVALSRPGGTVSHRRGSTATTTTDATTDFLRPGREPVAGESPF